ncbi:MAG: uracil-DNA glycosylase family protein, partial [Myxococcota bacterium]
MSDAHADLRRIIRQLRRELQWASRTGIEVTVSGPSGAAEVSIEEGEPLVDVTTGRPVVEREEAPGEAVSDEPPPAFAPDPDELAPEEAVPEPVSPESVRVRPAPKGRPWEQYLPNEDARGRAPAEARAGSRAGQPSAEADRSGPPRGGPGAEADRSGPPRGGPGAEADRSGPPRGGPSAEADRTGPPRGRPGAEDRRSGPPPERFGPPPADLGPPPDRFGPPPADSSPGAPPGSGAPSPSAVDAPSPREAQSLGQVREILGDCRRCKLHRGRRNIVFGVGNPDAEIMFVGEGPGQDEDRQGEPFVGKAGQLLTRIIEGGFKMRRSDVYIANIVKCRPPRNRDPEPDEVEACEPFLQAQIQHIQPRVIVALGKYAAQT